MKSGLVILIIGIVLIIGSIFLFALVYEQTVKGSESISLSPNGTKNYTISIVEGKKFMITFKSSGNISYEILSPNGTVIKKNENITEETFYLNSTVNGNYTIKFQNMENKNVDITIITMEEESFMSIAYKTLIAMGVCLVGFIILIAGGIMAILQRKKGKSYRRI